MPGLRDSAGQLNARDPSGAGTCRAFTHRSGMPSALDPGQIFDRAADEGQRRLDQGRLELLATGFIAGFTITFGSAAEALIHAAARPHFGEFATVLAALGFGLGVVFLILGRAELFSENFFDPIATLFKHKERHTSRLLARLWTVTLLLNIIGGTILILVFSVEGVLNEEAREAIRTQAHDLAGKSAWATFAGSIIGGALVALLSFLVISAQTSGARAAMAFLMGTLLALGAFEHVVVSMLHMIFGYMVGADLNPVHIAEVGGISLIGNLIGGVGLVTMSHAAQALGDKGD